MKKKVSMQHFQKQPTLSRLTRRQFSGVTASLAATAVVGDTIGSDPRTFQLNYLLASCMYGYLYIGEILPEVAQTGAIAIDLWPKVHGNQREQLDDLGEQRFSELLEKNNVQIGCLTQYKLGPFGLSNEMKLASRFGCKTIVTGGGGPAGMRGDSLKSAIKSFIEKMKPHLARAEETNVTIAIENHANGLFESADSLKWLVDMRPNERIGIALAPYHLPQDAKAIASLVISLDNAIEVFYAWQHGNGCHQRLPKEQEMLQLPGRGPLDFKPILKALRKINYSGWTEIFMHPVPRGISILESAKQVTGEINRSRGYLDKHLSHLNGNQSSQK
ncbi:MAG: sugar phosphate isomerase/epimerase [Mariniblastus sp.]|nr:sugar phosphate isomerase/epimerase [Mariniblastus sp.]